MIRLKTFGGVVLLRDGEVLEGAPAQRRRLALLVVLAVAGDYGVSRDRLQALLWPESNAVRASHNLAQLLHILHRDLSAGNCVTGFSELRLDPNLLTSDVAEFRDAIQQADRTRAVSLVAGPFLDGFHIDRAPEFERWADRQRARFSNDYGSALESLAREAGNQGDHARAVHYWRKLTVAFPLDTRSALGLMQALFDAGDRHGAVRHFDVHSEEVRRELNTIPDPSVARLAERLRAGPPISA